MSPTNHSFTYISAQNLQNRRISWSADGGFACRGGYNLVPRFLRLFGQRMVVRRDPRYEIESGQMQSAQRFAGCFYKLTLDLWLNFDSSICIITPGPPNCGIGWRSSAPHATSRHFLANLTRTFLDAVPSIAITFKESFCAHFQRKCNCLPKEILLSAKYEFTLTDEARRQRKHFLLSSPKWSF